MTCSICQKANRIFIKGQLVCPYCENIKIREKSDLLKTLMENLKANMKDFKQCSYNVNLSETVNDLIKAREISAKALLSNPEDSEAAIKWISCLYTLANVPKKTSGTRAVSSSDLLTIGRKIVNAISQITLCEQDKLVSLETGELCYTELQPLFHTTRDVDDQSFDEIRFKPSSTEARILERIMKAGMTEHLDAVESETLNRNFKYCFPKFLLPYKETKRMQAFEKTALTISFQVSRALGPDFSSRIGIFAVDMLGYNQLKKQLGAELGSLTAGLFSGKSASLAGENLGYYIFIEDTEQNRVYLTYYSLILLIKIIYKWIRNSPGYSNRLGEAPEDWIYNILTGYLYTNSPITGEKLLRYKLGKKKPEIDVIGYNDNKIVLVESKFWESSNVPEVEAELARFEKRIEHFDKNREQYGFSKDQEIITLFYFPWPPFPKYGKFAIKLIPSISAIMWYLLTNFPPKRRPFVRPTEDINNFLNDDNEERLFMSDLSDILEVEKDMFRIQDVQVDYIEENEITVFSYIPLGFATPFIFDIDKDCKRELKIQGVKHGSLIRTCTYNLRGYWSDIQLVSFKVLSLNTPFNPDEILIERNPNQYDSFLAATFGSELSKDLLNLIKKRKISLQRYIKWAEDSGHNVSIAVETLLARGNFPNFVLSQCDCGEVVGMNENLYSEFTKRHGPNVKCKNCDPDMKRKIENIVGANIFQIDGKDLYLK